MERPDVQHALPRLAKRLRGAIGTTSNVARLTGGAHMQTLALTLNSESGTEDLILPRLAEGDQTAAGVAWVGIGITTEAAVIRAVVATGAPVQRLCMSVSRRTAWARAT